MTFINAIPGAVAQGLVWAIMAIGLYVTYKVLDFADLTVDGSICTGAVVLTVLVTNGVSVYVAMPLAFLSGAMAGLATGLFHTLMGIPPILSGILTQLALWSVNLKVLGQANKSLSARNFHVVVTQLSVGKSILILALFVAMTIAVLYWFFGTERGCSIRATGTSEQMSLAQGISVKFNKVLALMISNGLVALSGALLAQYQGFADINMGKGAIVIGLASVIIGTAIITKISRNFAVQLIGVAIGSVIYYLVCQFVISLGLDTDLLKLLSAVVVAIFLALPYWKSKRQVKRRDGLPNANKGDLSKENK